MITKTYPLSAITDTSSAQVMCPVCSTWISTLARPAPAVPEDQLRAAFNAGLEAGAKVCEQVEVIVTGNHPYTGLKVQDQCIAAIRALKERS